MNTLLWAALGAVALCAVPTVTRAVDAKDHAIYSHSTARTMEEMIEALHQADVIFLGEQHDHKLGHALQLDILRAMHARDPNLALSMEMFERDVQLTLDEYLAGYLTESAFLAAARPWPNYKTDYRPLVEFCKENRLPVIAANAPRRYVNIVSRKGQAALRELPRPSKTYLARLPYSMELPDAYDRELTRIFAQQHDSSSASGQATMPSTAHMKEAQALWDATMADSILKARRAHRGRRILQVNGAMHSDSGYGIVDRLRRADPRLKVMIVTIRPDAGFQKPPVEQDSGVADFLILTRP